MEEIKREENEVAFQEPVEEQRTEETEKIKKMNSTEKLRKNPWILSSFVLGILVVILLMNSFSMTGGTVSSDIAGEKLIEFVHIQTDGEGELVEINDFGDYFYEVIVLFQGQNLPLYITKDGNYFSSAVSPLFEEEVFDTPSDTTDTTSSETPQEYSEEDNQKIQEFSQCLVDKGLRVYYAGWCGYCHALIEIFGGLENAGEMMIECQTADRQAGEGADLCAEENIAGFPTIKINGEAYSSARTFEAFAEATGCPLPNFD